MFSMKYYSQTSLNEYCSLDEHIEEETLRVEGETDTKPCKCNYCILKDMKKTSFIQDQYSYTLRMGN